MKQKLKAVLTPGGLLIGSLVILVIAFLASGTFKSTLKPAVTQQQLQQRLAGNIEKSDPPKSDPTKPVVQPPATPPPPTTPQPTSPAPAPAAQPLPESGPGTLLMIFIGISLVFYAASHLVIERRTIVFAADRN